MTRKATLRTLAAAAALIAAFALPASEASAVIVNESNGHTLSLIPHR